MLRPLALLLMASATTLGAQTDRIVLAPASAVTVEGTSNVHDWHATTTTLTARIEVATPVTPASMVRAVTVTIPVTSLRSGKDGLDKNLYKAMRADAHPDITYRMTSFSSRPDSAGQAAVVNGVLTANGVEKAVTLQAVLSGNDRALRAVGSATFNMTDFGIKPVTALLGMVRSADQVTVRFDIVGAAAQAIAGLPQR